MYTLEPNEKKLLERRKHWFIAAMELAGPVVLAPLPFILYSFFEGAEIMIGAYTLVVYLSPALITFLGSAWLLIFWMRGVGIWTDYYLDVWTITDKRIIDEEQKGFFHRHTSVFRLDRIQDVTVETRGLIATLLHFGDIHVQTAGEVQEFIMRGIANPKHVREIILKAQDAVSDRDTSINLNRQSI